MIPTGQTEDTLLKVMRAFRGIFLYIHTLEKIEGLPQLGYLSPVASINQVGYFSTPLNRFFYNDYRKLNSDSDAERFEAPPVPYSHRQLIHDISWKPSKLQLTDPGKHLASMYQVPLQNHHQIEWGELIALDIAYRHFNRLMRHYLQKVV